MEYNNYEEKNNSPFIFAITVKPIMQCIPATISQDRFSHRQDWFDKRRDFFVRQVFDDFFSILRRFQDLYLVYLSCRRPQSGGYLNLFDKENEKQRHKIWNKLTDMVGTEVDKGPLWQLKDLCHRLWPEEEYSRSLEGSLIDWLVGSIFHEAMKLKENIYLLNSYGPAARKISDHEGDGRPGRRRQDVTVPRLVQMMDIKGLIKRTAAAVTVQMDQLAFLFGQANCMLRTMTPELTHNLLLIRFLVEQESAVQDLWGEELDAVFDDMFGGTPEQGFCAAGRSYYNGQWYPQALNMYQRALAMNTGCDEAFIKKHQLAALVEQGAAVTGEGLPVEK